MDLIKLKIPAGFIMPRAHMTWREWQAGIEYELLDPEAVIDFAVQEICRLDHPPAILIELADVKNNGPVNGLVMQLATGEPERSEDELRDKWLYLTLAWLYEERKMLPDPLQTIEEVYADFGYPQELATFVRYMPTNDPDLGSVAANEQRLMERWKEYLDSVAPRYKR